MADVVTDAGKAAVAEKIGAVSTVADFTYLHLGSGTTAATDADTQIETPYTAGGLEPASATMSMDTDTVLQLVHVWTSTSNTQSITECGVSNTDTSGGSDDLLARSDFTSINVDTGDSIQITYKITVS